MRFVQGIDYGPRKGTLGFAVHLAEGGDGTLPYLARRAGESDAKWRERVRGVSANFVILSTGEIVQMVPWANASGSMNPSDRGKTTGFYRTQVIKAVLGSKYIDPNAYSLSVEITGYRAKGPNAAQVEALVRLVAMARVRYPGMVGAYGHADQTDTKGCPGTAPLMLDAWSRIGHGPFPPDTSTEDVVRNFTILYDSAKRLVPATLTFPDPAASALILATGKLVKVNTAWVKQGIKVRLKDPIVAGNPRTDDWMLGWLIGDDAAFVLGRNVLAAGYEDETYNAGVAAAAKAAAGAKRA